MQGFIGMLNEDIIVQKSLLPFKQDFETLHLENCKTIQEIVNKTIPYNFVGARLVVTLNNEIVSEDNWNKPLKKGEIVGLNFIPTGGGGGGKNVLTAVVVIAAAIAVPALAGTVGLWAGNAAVGAGLGGFGAGLGGFTGLAAGAYALGYGATLIAGSMLLSVATSALMSTPKQSGAGTSLSESQTQFIEGASNSIDKYGIIPVNLGTNRMFPPQAALPYTETSGNDQYCRQLFTYGYGNLLITDRKIGETSIDQFEGVEMDDRLNADLNLGTKLYTNDVYQENLNIKLTQKDGFSLRTTQSETDECELDLTFQGLVRYDNQANKNNATVEFEVQYAPTGTENWSSGVLGFEVSREQSLTVDCSNTVWDWKVLFARFQKQRDTFILLSLDDGSIYSTTTERLSKGSVVWPFTSNNMLVLGYIDGVSRTWIDNRQKYVGTYIENADDFIVTINNSDYSNILVNVGTGKILGVSANVTVTAASAVVVRRVKRIVFPSKGKYDIRIRRLTADSTDDKLRNDSYWTGLRSITYQNPVRFSDISGTAMRIKATDQLNGTVNSYNVIATTLLKGYNPDTKQWEDNKASSNPADIYRYVLQTPAFAKRVGDEKIDLDKLAEWWEYCDKTGLTYDRVIDYDTSIDDVLNDICAAGVATLSKVNNVYSVIIDNERPIVKGLVTPRNSWDYKGNINYPEIPHGLRIEFRNSEKGYETDERIVFADGYNEDNATLYERLQFPSCTNADLAYWYGRRYFATALLQPETHTFNMDFENLTFNRGDRITLVNDVILVGVGQGRITQLIVDDMDNPTVVTGFIIDDTLDIPTVNKLGVRIRDNSGKSLDYHLLVNVTGLRNEFTFAEPIEYNNAPTIGSLCAFVEDGKELDLIITQIKPSSNQSAQITAVDYAPARFEPIGEIPPFESNITIPADFYKPYAPILNGEVLSDESVMIKNSDGSLTSIIIIPLKNINEPNVVPVVRCRRKDTTEWFLPSYLKRDATEVILTGLDDGVYYDIEIRYQRQSGLQLLSDPLKLENIKFIGGSNPPGDVENFRISVTNGMALFEWEPNDDIDISHYVIKFTADTENATWETAQVAVARVTSNTVTTAIHKGMYLIKAVDLLGFESKNPTAIISTDTAAFLNVVEILKQEPDWSGVKENLSVAQNILTLSADQKEGYYYFDPQPLDLTEIYECTLTSDIKASLTSRNTVRDMVKIRQITSIRKFGNFLSIRSVPSIRSLTSVRTFGTSNWFVKLEMSLSKDGVNWTDWSDFVAAQHTFRYCKFRLHLYCESLFFDIRVYKASVTVDMPDRYESSEDVLITDAEEGATIKYKYEFRNNPAVNITVQDGAIDDKIEYVEKNNKGFTIKIFNGTLNTYVTRSFDYLAAGYGKVIKNESE